MTSVGDVIDGGTESLPEHSYGSPFIGKSHLLYLSGIDEALTNRIQRVDWKLDIPYNRRDTIGNILKDERVAIAPFTIESKFLIEVDDFVTDNLSSLICSNTPLNLSYLFLDCGGSTQIKLDAPNAKFKSHALKGDVGKNLSIELTYSSIINNSDDVIKCSKGEYI